MSLSDEIKKKKGRRISRKFMISCAVAGVCLVSYIGWLNVKYSKPPETSAVDNSQTDMSIQEKKIEEIMSDKRILLFEDFIIINGQKFRVELQNGQLMVFKDGTWIPLDSMSNNQTEGQVLQAGGKYFVMHNGQLVPLHAGDIIHRNGKSYLVGENGELTPIETNGITWKDGVPYVMGADGKLHKVEDGQIVTVNGKKMMYKDGKLIPVDQNDTSGLHAGEIISRNGKTYRVGADGQLIPVKTDGVTWIDGKPYVRGKDGKLRAVKEGETVMVNGQPYIWKNGKLVPAAGDIISKDGQAYKVGADGQLIPIDTKGVTWIDGKPYVKGKDGKLRAVKEGETVMINGKPYIWKNGHLEPVDQSSIDLKNPMQFGDYQVIRGHHGEAIYAKEMNDGLLGIDKSILKDGDIVYYKSHPYRYGADGKLHSLKKGDVVYRNGKAYVVDANGKMQPIAEGEVVMIGDKSMVMKNGHLVPATAEDAARTFQNKSLIWKDGKPYLVDINGGLHPIRDGQIIYRGGKAYRYWGGKFIPLDFDPSKVAKPAPKKDAKKPDAKPQDQSQASTENDSAMVGSDEELKKAMASSLTIDVKDASSTSSASNAPVIATGHTQDDTAKLLGAINQSKNEYAQVNDQAGKRAFLNGLTDKGIPDSQTDVQKMTSPYTLSMGTFISATLVTGINTDLPGQLVAQVNQNVFDSATGNYLLIPQGSKLIGAYDSTVSTGQQRVLFAWTTLVYPNGDMVDLKGQQGVDLSGIAGITGSVDNHWLGLIKNVLFMSIFGAGVQVAAGGASGGSDTGTNATQLIAASLGQQIGQAGMEIFKRQMQIQPTITVNAGSNFYVMLSKPFVFDAPYRSYNQNPLTFA
ncbi:MAG: hypothetical protein O2809_07565 [Proteobacteria bacterium]|nr:hypothetical protein [Pseudomonadota bacterium]